MADSSRLASRGTGICLLAASGVAVVASFQTWLQGGVSCGTLVATFVRADLWQLSGPWRPAWYSLALWLVMSGAFVLALVGINELGVPMLRWLDPWRWAPPIVGTALVAAGALLVHAPQPAQECVSTIATGPGKWIALVAAAMGVIAVSGIFVSMRSRQDDDDIAPSDPEGVKTSPGTL